MRSPYKAKRSKYRLGPRDAVFLHLGTSNADESLYPVPKARRGRPRNWTYCTVVDAE